MLRASGKAFGYEVDLRAVTDPSIDSHIPSGELLLEFTDAVLLRHDVRELREKLIADLGTDGLVGAAGVIGNFSMMNRIADATGMPVGKGSLERTVDIREQLGLNRFRHVSGAV